MKRRTLLQRMGCVLAVLGVTEAEWLTLGNRYYQALAQPSPRKLALLVGINQYPQSPALRGCLTDVELQKELLINRFGFLAADILTLTEEQASREFIEAAILDHLGKKAKPGDVVAFHFSGYGTRVKLGTLPDTMQNALVPVDENQNSQNDQIANYLLEETLWRLLRSLPTDRVTAVLDTSYYAPSILQPTGMGIRARPQSLEVRLADAELDFLQQLKAQNTTLNNPVVLSATSEENQVAQEFLLSGLSAGLFTYALTQYLWETAPAATTQVILSHVGSTMSKLGSNQQPALLSEQKNPQGALIVDDLLLDRTGAEGVVIATEDDGKTVYLWLAGLPPQVLEYYGVNSRLTLVTGEQLVLRSLLAGRSPSLKVGVSPSRSGLTVKAQIASLENSTLPQVGQLVQEAVRVLPRNIGLTVALDTRLERIERVDATSAFATFARVSTVVAGEQPADYVFGKLIKTHTRYALFSLGGELIPNTSGEIGEAVKVAVQRLAPKLPNLLAAKLWELTDNEGSSRLPVKGTLEMMNGISPRVVMQRETVRTRSPKTANSKSLSTPLAAIPTVPVGSRMQYRVQNLSDRPVYFMLLGLNSSSIAIAFYPWQVHHEPNIAETKPQLEDVVIAPGETLSLPEIAAVSEWAIPGLAYDCQHLLIFSTAPFSETLVALESANYSTGVHKPIAALVNPLEVAQALLQDLHNASAFKAETNGTVADSYILDVNHWASLDFSFQIV
ncbi:Caspase domain-containing protein [Cylindrospermum stagnale PCC 7417]|uniref:Caspase domain-containing protein n=1 Tax=Cylindrospermum stagnale PCC 7417 TaxID=56107 RepID=K9X0M6_9NOST|nr:caspase family protein [Cylindrospermum stagnale]AFZ25609.1 Caspase domain-containing protein [Cylindrospermum stagnale PCC 7417]